MRTNGESYGIDDYDEKKQVGIQENLMKVLPRFYVAYLQG